MAGNVIPRPSFVSFLLFFFVSTFSLNWTLGAFLGSGSGGLDLQTLRSRFKSRSLWNSSGLFISRRQLRRLRESRVLDEVFVVENSKAKFSLNGTCDMRTGVEKGEEMPQCDEVPRAAEGLNENNWAGTLNGCCNTRMRVELPQRVTSVITGQRHRVLQFTSSSQLVHTGYCQKFMPADTVAFRQKRIYCEGGMCVLGGRCTTVYRIQWLLVRASPIPTALTDEDSLDNDDDDDDDDGDDDDVSDSNESDRNMFVPAMVSNHCQCVFN